MTIKQGYWVIWRQKNGKMSEKFFERYWEAQQKRQDLIRKSFTDVSMQVGVNKK
jgi:hypothetical protein